MQSLIAEGPERDEGARGLRDGDHEDARARRRPRRRARRPAQLALSGRAARLRRRRGRSAAPAELVELPPLQLVLPRLAPPVPLLLRAHDPVSPAGRHVVAAVLGLHEVRRRRRLLPDPARAVSLAAHGQPAVRLAPRPRRQPRDGSDAASAGEAATPARRSPSALRAGPGGADPLLRRRRAARHARQPERARGARGHPARAGPRARRRRRERPDVGLQHRRPGPRLLAAPLQPRPPVGRVDRQVGPRPAAAAPRLPRHDVQALRQRRPARRQADLGDGRKLGSRLCLRVDRTALRHPRPAPR